MKLLIIFLLSLNLYAELNLEQDYEGELTSLLSGEQLSHQYAHENWFCFNPKESSNKHDIILFTVLKYRPMTVRVSYPHASNFVFTRNKAGNYTTNNCQGHKCEFSFRIISYNKKKLSVSFDDSRQLKCEPFNPHLRKLVRL